MIACNTASAAALHDLREEFPFVPFVGMEPAVKPAAEITKTGKIGVLATPMTFNGELYNSLVARFAQDVTIFQNTCPGLVEQIEAGDVRTPETKTILMEALAPMLAGGIDAVVLGCTHYPFVIPLIRELTGPEVEIINPAPAVARQVRRLLVGGGMLNPAERQGEVRYFTSGDSAVLNALLERLMAEDAPVTKVNWLGNTSLTLSD